MAQEYFYCWGCQTRLSGSDFERGRAFQIHDKITCPDCVKGLLAPLPIREQEEVLLMVKEAQERAKRPAPRPLSPPRSPAVHHPGKAHPRVYREQKSHPAVIALLILALVLIVGAAVFLARDDTPPVDPSRSGTAPGPMTGTAPPPAPRPSPPPKAPAPPGNAGEEAFRKASEFARAHPDDIEGQIARYREALPATEGTPRHDEVKNQLEALQKKLMEAHAAELEALDQKTRAACEREGFKEAVALLEEARKRRDHVAWTTAIDQKILQVNQEAWKIYVPLRDKALEAHRQGSSSETKALAERLKRWGLDPLITDLEFALTAPPKASDPAPPAPPAPPSSPPGEVQAYMKAWEKAAALAEQIDFGRAAHEMDDAARSIQDEALREQAASDVKHLRLAADLRLEALEVLSKWPRGRSLRLVYRDETGERVWVEGPVHRVDALSVEFVQGGDVLGVPLGEVTPGSLVQVLKGLPDRDPQADAAGAVTLCLLQGDLEGARQNEGNPPFRAPEKYWELGRRIAEQRGRGASSYEATARRLFWAAEREFRPAGTRGRAIEKVSTLLSEHAATALVRRNRELLARRLDAGKEFFFFPRDLAAAGLFKPAEHPKVGPCWTSSADILRGKATDNYLELEFYALPNTAYLCWVHAGACCGETFAFYYQATDMEGAEMGSERGLPAKHSILFLKKYHAQHGGPKQPARWDWVPLPLPSFSAAGLKKVRVFTDQQGFSVSYAVVSALREDPPREQEVRDLVKARAVELPAEEKPSPEAPPQAPETHVWRRVFDGRSLDGLTAGSAASWRVEDGALVPAPGAVAPAETRETFAEGQIRIRFEVQELESLFFKMLQGDEGYYRAAWNREALRALEGKTLELVFMCRRDEVTATLDGNPATLVRTGQPRQGSLQFGAVGKSLRVLSIEHR